RADNARRTALAARLDAGITEAGAPETGRAPRLVPLRPDTRGTSSWHAFVVKAARRAELPAIFKRLNAEGVGHQVYYPAALPDLPVYRQAVAAGRGGAPSGRVDVPVARALARTCVALPLHPAMTRTELRAVIAATAPGL